LSFQLGYPFMPTVSQAVPVSLLSSDLPAMVNKKFSGPGVDVLITIFYDFRQFLAK
jgi:hypothetical protein